MIKRYQSTWNIWSTCTNTLCYQLKYFLFLFGFTLLAARYDLFLTGTAILSSDNSTLAWMRKSCGQSCHLNRDEKEVGGHWSGPGGKVNPLSVMDLSSWAPLLGADWDALHTTRASTYLLSSQNMVVMSHEKNRNTPKHYLKHKALGQKLALWLTTCDM